MEKVEEESKTGEVADPASIVSEITATMPAPNEDAVAEHLKEKQEQEEINSQFVDNKGNPFDANIHKVDKSGNPVLTSTGKLSRKPGRKANTGSVKNASILGNVSQGPKNTTPENLEQKQSAIITVDCLLTTSQMFGGEEFAPKIDVKSGLDERETMIQSFEKYYIAKGIGDIPPGALLALTLTSYFGPRFFMPQTQSRMSKIKMWFKYKFFSKKGNKNAQSDSGDNGKRENTPSEEIGKEFPITEL
jgi:hypothetical protein